MQFQKESKITTKMGDQNTIEGAHSCLVNAILQAEEKTIPKDVKRLPVAWWNKECLREKRIVRTEYIKHHRDPTLKKVIPTWESQTESFHES